LLKRSVGVDFTYYKPNTIKRRIIRRMLLYKLPSLKAYLHYLKQHTNEIHVLFQDLLINVTAFFRDADTLEYLKKSILTKIMKSKLPNEAIRVWVPACSTGEEAYSIAILLSEIISEKGLTVSLQVFASDLSENAIAKARIGLYSKSDVADVSQKRLQRFFTRIDGSYRINKIIRDACVFAPHNVISDPPFSRLDLITCCNLMIYLDPVLQKKLIATFHYSLKPDGYLILGKSETLGTSTNLFSQVDKKFKVFARKNDVSAKIKFEMNYRIPEVDRKTPISSHLAYTKVRDLNFESRVEELLLSKYVAASVVVNKDLDILQFHGPINSFLEISPGKATLNLLKLVRPGLVFDLRNTIHKATKSNKPEKKSGLEVTVNSIVTMISAEVIPVGKGDEEKVFLIVFQKVPPAGAELKKSSHTKDQIVKKMQAEIEATKEDIRAILEEQEASNEELQSANEEIVSSNEELQSINEELETSKEEVESSNEELMTINNELQVRNEQLAEAHEYSEAIAETIREAVLILDRDFRVRSANKAFYRIFKTNEEETEGMLIYELGNRQWDILELRQLLEELIWKRTIITGYEVQHDFPAIGRKVMLLHGRAIVQKLLQKELIIVAIEDITEHRKAQRMAEERELWFRNMADNAPCMIWTTGPDKVRSFFNKTWYEFIGKDGASTDREFWVNSIHRDDRNNYLDQFNKGFASKSVISVEYRMKRADGEYRWVLDIAKPYYADDQKFLGYIGTSTELHDKRLLMDELDRQVRERTKELKSINIELKRSNSELEQFAYVASHDLQEPLRKILTYIDRIENQDGQLPAGSKAFFEKIVESARRMTKLIDDLLDFSTISFSKKTFVKVDLNTIIKDVLADLELLSAEKKGKVMVEGKIPVIQGEPLQMTQLFYNLIGNALKFTRDSVAPTVKISNSILTDASVSQYKELDVPGPYVQLIISDNGIGFSPEFAEQIFIIFQRLNERKKFPGTGIGLALCKRIVANHHGHIFAKSNSNGSEFYVILPLSQEGNGNNEND